MRKVFDHWKINFLNIWFLIDFIRHFNVFRIFNIIFYILKAILIRFLWCLENLIIYIFFYNNLFILDFRNVHISIFKPIIYFFSKLEICVLILLILFNIFLFILNNVTIFKVNVTEKTFYFLVFFHYIFIPI